MLFAMSIAFMYRDFSYSRLVFLLIFVNTMLFLLVERAIFHAFKRYLLAKGLNMMHICLVGSASKLELIYQQIHDSKNHNFRIEGYFCDHPLPSVKIPYYGKPQDLPKFIKEAHCDGIVMTFDQGKYEEVFDVTKALEGRNIELFYVPNILDIATSNPDALQIGKSLMLRLKASLLSGWRGFIKRMFDVAMSAIGIILCLPIWIGIALIVKFTSKGPILYRQKRVSLDGREFGMLKFRSMRVDAEVHTGPVWTKEKDDRVTSIGHFLRRTSLDELPQLLNVLKGDMSLVGPRPERLYFVEQFQKYIPRYLERHRVRCGVTGWAQVNGLRGQSSIEERTRYDLYYIDNWSLWLDIKIILMTVMAVIKGENAY